MQDSQNSRINAVYSDGSTLGQVRDIFAQDEQFPSVLMQHFFAPEFYKKMQQIVSSDNLSREVKLMHHSMSTGAIPKELAKALNDCKELFTQIVGGQVTSIELQLQVFNWKDYVILHDHDEVDPGLDIVIDLTDEWDPKWGGFLAYVDGTGHYRAISPSPNSVLISERKPGVRKFVKYVNHYAGDHQRILVVGKLIVKK